MGKAGKCVLSVLYWILTVRCGWFDLIKFDLQISFSSWSWLSEAVAALDKKGFRRVLLYGCSIFGKAESWLFCLSFLESPKLKAELFIDLWFITHNSYDFYHFLSFSVVQLIKEERKRCHESLESAQLAFPLYGRTKAWVEQLLSSARPNNMLTMYGTTSSRDILWSLMMYWYLTGLAAFFSSTESLNVA